MKIHPSVRRIGAAIIIGIGLYATESCSVIRRLEVDSPTWNCVGSGQHYCHDTTIRTSLWKGKNNIKINADCDHISRIKVTTKPGDIIVGFITFGFVVRQRIEWDCGQSEGTNDM